MIFYDKGRQRGRNVLTVISDRVRGNVWRLQNSRAKTWNNVQENVGPFALAFNGPELRLNAHSHTLLILLTVERQ